MSEICIVRTDEPPLSETDSAIVRRYLFGCVKGMGEDDARAWRKFWRNVRSLEVGEMLTLAVVFPRLSKNHRGYMKLESDLFAAQERVGDRELFRNWIKTGANWIVWLPGARGAVAPIPRSISFKAADESEFNEYVLGALDFIRSHRFAATLWPHLSEFDRHAMVDGILQSYERFLRRFD